MTVSWLRQLPKKWEAAKLKTVVELRTDRGNERLSEENYIGLENIESWTGRLLKSKLIADTSDDENERDSAVNYFEPGNVLFGKLRPYLAKAHLAQESGVCTTELLVMKPSNRLDGQFLLNVVLTREFIDRVNAETLGAKMPRADWDTISNLSIPIPPLSAQRAIAAYLDRETTEIDALIAAKQRLLELLAEQRRALITHAVTRGLNPDAPMRDSEMEWLGKVPAHWAVERLKFLIDGIDTGFSPQCYNFPAQEAEWGVLKTGCVNGGMFNSQENKTLPEDIDPPLELEVKTGDVLMSRASGSTDLIGSVALVENQPSARLLLSDKTFRIRLNPHICDAKFFVITMGSFFVRQQILQIVSGAEGLANNIAQTDIRELLLPLPPIEEQKNIAAFVEQNTCVLDTLSITAVKTVEYLHERRAALIAAAVTGQIDVAA
jgi:type I restriction enzyme S subunit